jgi:hypothetical protein
MSHKIVWMGSALASMLVACGSSDANPSPETKSTSSTAQASASSATESATVNVELASDVKPENHPPPVVTISVGPNGQRVEFYDFNDMALVMERGLASGHPVLPTVFRAVDPDNTHAPARLVDLFHALRPDLPVPDALITLRDKLAAAPRPDRATTARLLAERAAAHEAQEAQETGGAQPETSGIHPEAVCSNNCCNQAWTQANICGPGPSTAHWNYFDYLWDGETGSNFGNEVDDIVCGAVGTSSWYFEYCSNGCAEATYNVTQQEYLIRAGIANWPFDVGFNTYVNSSTNPHLHTHCGGAW